MKQSAFTSNFVIVITIFIMALTVQTVNASDDVNQLIKTTNSKSSYEKNYSTKRALYLLSSTIKKNNISQETKSVIENQFHKNTNKETILLAGLAGVESLSNQIQLLADKPIEEPKSGRFYGTNEWAANLVLAGQGNTSNIAKLLDYAKKQDTHTLVVFILVDLQYIPQPEIVEFLKEYLDSDERLEPVKPTVDGILAANYAASSLARILQDFPVNYREDYSYSIEEIKNCRAWMSKQKEWKFK